MSHMLECAYCVLCDVEVINNTAIDYCKYAKKPIGKVDEKTKRMAWCPFDSDGKTSMEAVCTKN